MSCKLRLKPLACLALLSSGFATAALADTETRRIGSQTGTQFELACEPGEAIAGWHYNSRARLYALWPMCVTIDDQGRPTGPSLKTNNYAGADLGVWRDPISCKSGQALRRLDVGLMPDMSITAFRAICHGPGTAPAYTKPTVNIDGIQTARGVAECPARTYASAFIGTFRTSGPNQGMTSLGLRCSPLIEAAADPRVDENGDNQAGGNRGSANTDTTVYDEPEGNDVAYLTTGDPVRIVQCGQPENWCQISAPAAGWVWGPELDR